MIKNQPVNTGDIRDVGLILGLERSPGGGLGNSLQYSCLENPIDTGGWRATVYKVAQSQTQLKQLSMSSLAFHMMYSACKLNKQGDNIQP